MYESEIDLLTLLHAIRGITIVFIIGILGANCKLIFKTIRQGGFFYTPKSLTLISLAIGDIFLALFSLIVDAKSIFEGFDATSCTTKLTSSIYGNCLIHFVYATGLVVLAAELVYRYRKQTSPANTKENILKALACSAFPWIPALVIILPLMLAGSHANSDFCFEHLTAQKGRAALGVSVILPAIVAVIICIVVMCIRFSPAYYTFPTISYHVTNQDTFINQQSTHIINQHQVLANSVGNEQYPLESTVVVHQFPVDSTGPQEKPNVPDNSKQDPSLAGQAFSAPYTQYPAQQHPAQQVQAQCPTQQYQPTQYPVQNYVTRPIVVIAAPGYLEQVQNTPVSGLHDPVKEKRTLLLVSIIHFICVVPNAAYTLGYKIDGYQTTYEHVVTSLTFAFLSVFRSLVTPCIFTYFNK